MHFPPGWADYYCMLYSNTVIQSSNCLFVSSGLFKRELFLSVMSRTSCDLLQLLADLILVIAAWCRCLSLCGSPAEEMLDTCMLCPSSKHREDEDSSVNNIPTVKPQRVHMKSTSLKSSPSHRLHTQTHAHFDTRWNKFMPTSVLSTQASSCFHGLLLLAADFHHVSDSG